MRNKVAKRLRKEVNEKYSSLPEVRYNDWHPPHYEMVNIGGINRFIKTTRGKPCALVASKRQRYQKCKKEYYVAL
jgi:hypothetical protein